MALEPKVMKAVEALNYRATVGDVAAQAGAYKFPSPNSASLPSSAKLTVTYK